MTPTELGESLARLVWESVSDDLADPDMRTLFRLLHLPMREGVLQDRAFEELLIFHLWLHTRSTQSGIGPRAGPEVLRRVLDILHRAVFEDMVDHGTPPEQIPVFEERASARYEDYYAAARESVQRLGHTVATHLAGTNRKLPDRVPRALAARAVEVGRPLEDYLEEVDLAVDG